MPAAFLFDVALKEARQPLEASQTFSRNLGKPTVGLHASQVKVLRKPQGPSLLSPQEREQANQQVK